MTTQCAWWVNQIGILIEIAGAGYLVWCALRSRQAVMEMKTDLDSIEHSVQALLDEVRGNFKNQCIGFVLLVIGLLMQLASNGLAP